MSSVKSAIPPDEVFSRSLGEMSAADLLQVLNRHDLDRSALAILPDKKKWELWVDEEIVLKQPLGDLLEHIRTEKKKLELEKYWIEDIKLSVENVVDPSGRLVDPVVGRARLVEEIANAVARKVRG